MSRELENRDILQGIFGKGRSVKSLIFILLFMFSTTWISAIVYDFFKSISQIHTFIFLGLFSATVLIYLYFTMIDLYDKYSSEDKIDIDEIDTKAKKVLILFLSKNDKIEDNSYNSKKEIDEWLETKWNNWKIPFLSIEASSNTIETLYVLTSPDSRQLFDIFKKMVETKYSQKSLKLIEKHVEDIHDINLYKSIFHEVYQECQEYKMEDISIDITSGTKLYSIASSYYALSFDKVVQYVDDKYHIRQFNNRIVES